MWYGSEEHLSTSLLLRPNRPLNRNVFGDNRIFEKESILSLVLLFLRHDKGGSLVCGTAGGDSWLFIRVAKFSGLPAFRTSVRKMTRTHIFTLARRYNLSSVLSAGKESKEN